MRNLKKILALVLALMMTLSLMVTANATNFTDDSKINSDYAVAAEVLTDIGIFQGDNKGQFLPDTTLNRKDASTLIYRIMTGDVADKYVSNYAGYASQFSDVSENAWYAPYVAYAALNGYIKGYDGKFNPDAPLTGIEVLTILLRAVGYDQHNEFSTDWVNTVAKQAQKVGISIPGVTLTAPVTREVAAELIFQVMTEVKMVEYTSLLNYQPIIFTENGVKSTKTLGAKIFSLSAPYAVADIWGRPGYEYSYKVNGKKGTTTIDIDYSNTYTTATALSKLGKDTKADIYTNGVYGTIDLTKSGNLGAQGTLIEVYEDFEVNDKLTVEGRIVVIDTYLAYVDSDKGDLSVYFNGPVGTAPVTMEADVDSYNVDDAVLVNVNVADKDNKAINIKDDKTGKLDYTLYTVEIVEKAPSVTAAQTKIIYNADQHEVGNKVYDDAAHFYLDEAGLNRIDNFVWYQDQYGNLIGSEEIDRTSYAVLKDIIWTGTPNGYAQATLVYLDGTEKTVTVDRFDGLENNFPANDWPYGITNPENGFAVSNNNEEPTLSDSTSGFPGVSTNWKYNEIYEGYALYMVITLDNDTVRLEGISTKYENKKWTVAENFVNYEYSAVIDTNSSVIWVGTDNKDAVYITDDTQFLVRNSDNTYSAYTRATLPEYEYNTEIFYTSETNSKGHEIASRVYIKNGVIEAELGGHLYVPSNNYARQAGIPNTWEMVVNIDGVERTILSNRENIEYLAANVGKVFHTTWETNAYKGYYGFLEDVKLVNEAADVEPDCNYLSGTVTISGNTIVSSDEDSTHSYTVDKDTILVGANDLSKVDTTKNGIWVVRDRDDFKTTHAAVVFVGTKLDDQTGVTAKAEKVDAKVEVGKVDKNNDATITVTIPLDKDYKAQRTDLTITSLATSTYTNDAQGNTLLEVAGLEIQNDKNEDQNGIYEGSVTLENLATKTDDINSDDVLTFTVTVYPEDGVQGEVVTYTVKVINESNHARDNAIESIYDKSGEDDESSKNVYCKLSDTTAYETLALALTKIGTLNVNGAEILNIDTLVDEWEVEYAVCTSTADAKKLGDSNFATFEDVDASQLVSNNYLVLKITKSGSMWLNDYEANGCTTEALYVVYQITTK